jgi:hypothetical protein
LTSEAPVITGLFVGIALIVMFSINFSPYYNKSDEELWEYVNAFPEVQAFNEKYENVDAKIWRGPPYMEEGRRIAVTFASPAASYSQGNDEYARRLILHLYIGYSGVDLMALSCGATSTYHTNVTVEAIMTNQCLNP